MGLLPSFLPCSPSRLPFCPLSIALPTSSFHLFFSPAAFLTPVHTSVLLRLSSSSYRALGRRSFWGRCPAWNHQKPSSPTFLSFLPSSSSSSGFLFWSFLLQLKELRGPTPPPAYLVLALENMDPKKMYELLLCMKKCMNCYYAWKECMNCYYVWKNVWIVIMYEMRTASPHLIAE